MHLKAKMTLTETANFNFNQWLRHGRGSWAAYNLTEADIGTTETFFVRGLFCLRYMTVKITNVTPHADGHMLYDFDVVSAWYADAGSKPIDQPKGRLWDWFGIF